MLTVHAFLQLRGIVHCEISLSGLYFVSVTGSLFHRPFWLSPRQAIVIPVAPVFEDYAKKVWKKTASLHLIILM